MLLNLNRPNVRGIKKCHSCGLFNGNRSKSCKNQNCPQFLECNSKWKRPTKNVKYPLESPADPIRLISQDKDVQYFSVKVADKLTTGNCLSRSVVRIEERTIETDRNTVIICRTAVCYEATCMKSVTSLANCRHIVECLSHCKKAATELPIIRSKFLRFFSHLTEGERIELWDYYSTCRGAVQQLRNNVFVVKAMHCGDKENSGALNVKPGINDFVHCELGHKTTGREPVFRCSCTKYQSTTLCHHILLLYSAIDGDPIAREQFKMHLEFACKKLDLHELDLFDLGMDLGLNWDLNASEIINDMITEEILQGESLELSDQEMEFIDDLLVEDFEEFFKDPNESVVATHSNHGMNLSVSFDTILTSIIERMNCNFTVWSREGPRPEKETNVRQDDFVFYVHNDFFSCLKERFSSDPRKRCQPSETVLHGTGLSTQLYTFDNPTTLVRIFTSKSTSIKLEQFYFNGEIDKQMNSSLEHTQSENIAVKKCISLHEGDNDKSVKISWTADVLPTSSHGELKISFRYDYQTIN